MLAISDLLMVCEEEEREEEEEEEEGEEEGEGEEIGGDSVPRQTSLQG